MRDILVVEDNDDVRRIVVHRLARLYWHGEFGEFSIREAWNGRLAVDLVKASRPDVIFMDIKMPVMDGLKATELIRDMEGGKTIHIVCLTADYNRMHATWRAHGFDRFMCQPVVERDAFTPVLRTVFQKSAGGTDGSRTQDL